jgi:hypothetical protein
MGIIIHNSKRKTKYECMSIITPCLPSYIKSSWKYRRLRVSPVFKSGLLKCKADSSTDLGLQDQEYPFPEQVGRLKEDAPEQSKGIPRCNCRLQPNSQRDVYVEKPTSDLALTWSHQGISRSRSGKLPCLRPGQHGMVASEDT